MDCPRVTPLAIRMLFQLRSKLDSVMFTLVSQSTNERREVAKLKRKIVDAGNRSYGHELNMLDRMRAAPLADFPSGYTPQCG